MYAFAAQVRLQLRACTDETKIHAFLERAETGFLGLSNENRPYVVPLNYVWMDGAVYFHGAEAGRKVDDMRQNALACFTVSESYGTITDPVPAHTDTAYMSVMLFGSLAVVEQLDEATAVMQKLLDKYVPGFYRHPLAAQHVDKYRSSLGSRTIVFKLTVDSMTAKENAPKEDRMFRPGQIEGMLSDRH
ncbi:pyridoxamine 5'-phosphate oxidase-related FMN-binding protein [Paenibacillus curdlanolyticus YK9]|uniref:Pyridoxamine 5'-phosphate oxidase-related FMN-binding protein n=1 Tax=Paenibacillus curdlanolyticus YK9 TaxID=717606 RepID=E0I7Q1_9BACL|nr:pyridoxamine 5'-phosphate oxidase family protein [Paenibacillus curdlanolyticus]EFM11206.1 pyridoxamine 5'-phosphate oxidase-related FMN-binding protein [Paenibacillus curdlanolyticus YK9]